MHTVRYASTEHSPVPIYNAKGEAITSGPVQHYTHPVPSQSIAKVVLLDTRVDDKTRSTLTQQQQTVDKEALDRETVRVYETKLEERLDSRDGAVKQAVPVVQQMQKPLPSVPAVVQSSELLGRVVSENEPRYVTVYEDGAQLFSPRTTGLLGAAARLPPPPPPAEPTTPTETMQYAHTATVETAQAVTTVVQTKTTVVTQPAVPLTTVSASQPVGAVAVPSWPPAQSEHREAASKRVVEASTMREESPLLVGVEKPHPSPLIVSAGPQPYDLPHPKNAIDVVQLPPRQPTVPVAQVQTVAEYAAPLPLLPPTPLATQVKKPIPAPPALPAPFVSTAAVPALPAPKPAAPAPAPKPAVQAPRPTVKPVPVSAPAPAPAAAPRRPFKMPRLVDVVFSPYAIGGYLLLGLLALSQLPFWLLVALAVALDAVVIAYKRPVKQPSTTSTALVPVKQASTVVVPAAPQPLPLPAPQVSQPAPMLPLPAPAAQAVPAAPALQPQPQHVRAPSREFGTQTEPETVAVAVAAVAVVPATMVTAVEEHEEAVPVPRSPAQFFASLRQQHGGSPPAKDKQVVVDRLVPTMKKLAPSARQQATIPLLADAQSVAPEGVHLSESYHVAPSPSTITHGRYEHPVPHVQPAVLPSPSSQPSPVLDALNSASPRRELKELTHSADQYNDMQPDAALSSQVLVAARRGVAGIPASDAAAAVQGAANPVVMVPTWPSNAQQHEVAQARHVVEASTVRDHSVLLDDASTDSGAHVPPQSQPYSMQAVPHSTTLVNQTDDMLALPAPKGPVSTTAPLALPFPAAPSFRVSAADSAPVAAPAVAVVSTSVTSVAAVQPVGHEVHAVKRVVSEEKEEVVVADVGTDVSVGDVGAGITQADNSALRLRNIASHAHTQ